MARREIKRTNEEGTCLWCGERLTYKCSTEWHYVAPQKNCPHCKVELVPSPGTSSFVYEGHSMWDCPKCKSSFQAKRKVKSRKRWHDKPGAYGDGFFCTLNCGRSFGVAAANNGYRFVPTKDEDDGQ